jgi:hypothetical protein
MTALATQPTSLRISDKPEAEAIERLVMHGDLKALTAEQRVAYHRAVCDAAGLDYRLNPFEYLTLNGKMILYAKKSCTEQLRNNRRINVQIVSRDHVGDCYVVTARAMMPDGRQDESIGAVSIGNAKGDNLANALMKAETKAKRRVTLSICGLGILDETELETIPAYRQDARPNGSLKDRLKGTQAEGLVNAVEGKLGGEVVAEQKRATPEDDAAHLAVFMEFCEGRQLDGDEIYKKVSESKAFQLAYNADPEKAWARLIAKVEAGEYDPK